ncbi:MAG: SelB C-terminal domain-containing protein [Variovorax sp.]|nr:SelB C-terminal domain-containing protein [Variovorax sp.]
MEVRDFRDAVRLGRERAIQILQFFDRDYTRRARIPAGARRDPRART